MLDVYFNKDTTSAPVAKIKQIELRDDTLEHDDLPF